MLPVDRRNVPAKRGQEIPRGRPQEFLKFVDSDKNGDIFTVRADVAIPATAGLFV
jgi:hypothetical protein